MSQPLHSFDPAYLPTVDVDALFSPGKAAAWRPNDPPLPSAVPASFLPTVRYGRSPVPLSPVADLAPQVLRLPQARVFGGTDGNRFKAANGRFMHRGGQLLLTEDYGYFPDSMKLNRLLPAALVDETSAEPRLLDEHRFEQLDGAWLYAGPLHRHFGHLIVDSLSRLWPLVCDDRFAQLGILHVGEPLDELTLRVFAELGVGADRFRHVTDPVVVERLLVPTRGYLHLDGTSMAMEQLFLQLGDRIAASAPASDAKASRVFLSRSGWRQDVRGMFDEQVHRLDDFFAQLGFRIVHPEGLDLAEQIQLARAATHLAGCTGSAHHILAFARTMPKHLVIAPEDVVNWNDVAIHRPKGTAPTFFLSDQLEPRPPALLPRDRRFLRWGVDFDELARAVDQWLQSP